MLYFRSLHAAAAGVVLALSAAPAPAHGFDRTQFDLTVTAGVSYRFRLR